MLRGNTDVSLYTTDRERGWAVNDAELSDDARAAGAALLGPAGKPVWDALVVCGPSEHFVGVSR
ncbi:hypothetical protein I546_6984 [Mycobacterium kansasii 732]|nr:hypothetical protein I546_6984 [Mycobacterium kansasii 732]